MAESNVYGWGDLFGQPQPQRSQQLEQAQAELVGTLAPMLASYWKALVTCHMSEHAATALCIALQDQWTTPK